MSEFDKHVDRKRTMAEATQTRYRVEGMDCASCAAKIDTAVRRMPGVSDVSVSVTAGTMTVKHDDASDLTAIAKKVSGLGYSVSQIAGKVTPVAETNQACCGHDHGDHSHAGHSHAGHSHAAHSDHDHATHDHGDHDHNGHDHASHAGHDHSKPAATDTVEGLHGHDHGPSIGPWWASKKGRMTILAGAALVTAYAIGHLVPSIASYAFIIAMLVGLIPIARRAVMAAMAGTPFSIEMLMTIAAVGAVIINAGEEAAAVVFLFLVGELLEGVAAGKARQSIQSLAALVPKEALLEENGQTRAVPAESLAVGATILVRPGDRISADGLILSGESAIDEAPVTGESTPVRKGVDEKVFAGTINGDAALRVRVTATAADNTIARVVKLVEEAQESKAPTERFIDRFSRYYTPGVVVVAALVAIIPPLFMGGAWGEWVYEGLAILLIGCPCALVISTPAAIAASLSAGARRGLLLKGGARAGDLRNDQRRGARQDRHAHRGQAEGHGYPCLRLFGDRRADRCRCIGNRIEPSARQGDPRQGSSRQDLRSRRLQRHGARWQGRNGNGRRPGCFPRLATGGWRPYCPFGRTDGTDHRTQR